MKKILRLCLALVLPVLAHADLRPPVSITTFNVVSGTATNIFVSTAVISHLVGTTTNDNATVGTIGEYVEADASATNFPTTANFGDLVSVNISSGDWDFSVVGVISNNSSVFSTAIIGASVNPGNSGTGLVNGTTAVEIDGLLSSTALSPVAVPSIRFSVNVSTTVILKYYSTYTGGPPKLAGRISARRMR